MCALHPEKLPHPLTQPATAIRLPAPDASSGSPDQRDASVLDVRQLIGEGVKIAIPGDDAILIHVR